MASATARSANSRVESHAPLFENPEVAAMTAICNILRDLPDDDARLRVMRWAFGRFSDEFKRPLPDTLSVAAPAAPAEEIAPASRPAPEEDNLTLNAYAAAIAPPEPQPQPMEPLAADDTSALDLGTVAVAPELDAEAIADIAGQISELHDLFGARPERPANELATLNL